MRYNLFRFYDQRSIIQMLNVDSGRDVLQQGSLFITNLRRDDDLKSSVNTGLLKLDPLDSEKINLGCALTQHPSGHTLKMT